jgi:hypothetical protein
MKLNSYFNINRSQKGIYDIELHNIKELQEFSSVESHILVYPLSRNITADHIICYPFEEYAQDIKEGDSSVYSKVSFVFNKALGITLGILILIIFLIVAPQAFLSIDSVVAIFAAYIIGKELGEDLENFLINVSHNWKLQFYKDYFKYCLEKATPFTNYTRYAKKQRYGKVSVLPSRMDFDKRSNSQIVRMKFKRSDLEEKDNIHILSIKISEKQIQEFEKEGYVIGFKLCLNKKGLLLTDSLELFQAVSKESIGCLNEEDKVLKDHVFFRKVLKMSRIRFNSTTGILKGKIISR